MRRLGIRTTLAFALTLLLPPFGRAFLHNPEEIPAAAAKEPVASASSGSPHAPSKGPRRSLVRKVEKVAFRVPSAPICRWAPPRREATAAPPPCPAAFRLSFCAEITKPDSLRIFLFGTPHNHRAPPA